MRISTEYIPRNGITRLLCMYIFNFSRQPNKFSKYLWILPPSMVESSISSTFAPWLEIQLRGGEWRSTKLERLSVIRCCKILRKGAIAFRYLFIQPFNKYLIKICYISGTVLGSGDTSVKQWIEFPSSWS